MVNLANWKPCFSSFCVSS